VIVATSLLSEFSKSRRVAANAARTFAFEVLRSIQHLILYDVGYQHVSAHYISRAGTRPAGDIQQVRSLSALHHTHY
jgi:hypothetical protein